MAAYQHPGGHRQISPFLNSIVSGAIGVPDAEGLCIQQCKGISKLKPDSPRDRDEGGNGALHFAMKRGWVRLAEYLLEEHGLPADDVGEAGQCPIHWASAWASVRAIALLAKHGASLEARCADGCVPLHFAAMHGKHTIVYYLLSKGCRADVADSQGYTAMHRASCKPHRLAVTAMLDFGNLSISHTGLINQRDAAGRNALHWASTTPEGYDKQAVIRALLEAGCDVSGPGATDNEGRDVLAHASHHGFERTAKQIEEYLALKRSGVASASGSGALRGLIKLPPLSWVALGLSTIWRNVAGGKRESRKEDIGVGCVMWFYGSISCGMWVWWSRFLAQDGVHSHFVLSITFLVFLVAEVVAYTSMVHSSPGFLATGSQEIADSIEL